jgi:hypothetical protein
MRLIEVSVDMLNARIDALRWSMLGAQKELGALREGGDLRSWPELLEQLAMLRDEIAKVHNEIRLAHQRRLGQSIIDVCFPRTIERQSAHITDFSALAATLENALIAWIRIRPTTAGEATIVIRCELNPEVDHQLLIDAGILTPTIDIHLENGYEIQFNRQSDRAYWGGEQITGWEAEEPGYGDERGHSLTQRIRGSSGMLLQVTHWGVWVSEVLD